MHLVRRLDHSWWLLRLSPGWVSVDSRPSVGLPLTGMHPCMADPEGGRFGSGPMISHRAPWRVQTWPLPCAGMYCQSHCAVFFVVSLFFLYFYLFLAFRFISYFSNNVWSCPCFCLLLSLSSILFYLVPSCFPTLSRTVFFTVLSLHLSLALSQFGNRA